MQRAAKCNKSVNNILRKNVFCNICNKKPAINRLSIEACIALAAKANGLCLSNAYKGALHNYTWQCVNKHTWRASYADCNSGSWCPKCRGSKSERHSRIVFEDYFGKKFPSIRPKWLRNPKTNMPLELDGYNEELRMAFEYDGEQHYMAIGNWKGEKDLIGVQERDVVKSRLCQEKGIALIRIPYWEKDNLKQFITNILDKVCIIT